MTTFDSVNLLWAISGSVKDVTKFQLNNVKVTALFYDSRGNIIGLIVISNVNPGILNPFEDRTFSFKSSIKI
ncbi:MAG: FxLYD domain-containing protein [Candidatus Nitrosocosmicus sp.]